MFNHRHELAETLVELAQQKAIKCDDIVEEPEERRSLLAAVRLFCRLRCNTPAKAGQEIACGATE